MAVVNMEMLSFMTKFAELSCQGINAKLYFTSNNKNISINMEVELGCILPPNIIQPNQRTVKPSRKRRQKYRESIRRQRDQNNSTGVADQNLNNVCAAMTQDENNTCSESPVIKSPLLGP